MSQPHSSHPHYHAQDGKRPWHYQVPLSERYYRHLKPWVDDTFNNMGERTTTPYASNGHARVRLNCVVVAGGFSYLFHYFMCLYFCRMRTWIFLRMPTALCACLVQPTLCATCSHSLVMVAPRSGAFGRRRGNKSCGSLGILRHALQCGGIFGEILRRVLLKCLNANVYSSTVQP